MKKRQINKAKRVAHSCRNNGTCNYCKGSRLQSSEATLLQAQKAMVSAAEQELEAQGKIDGWDIDVAQYKMEDR